jgi:hypothetical protein
MKNFLFIMLSLSLAAVAFFTRPTEDDFKSYVSEKADRGAPAEFLGERPTAEEGAVDGYVFTDRILWVNVQRDGRTLYTGVFDHWFDHKAVAAKINTIERVSVAKAKHE